MTNAMKLELLSKYGIVDYDVIKQITGMSKKEYKEALSVKVPSYYNGLFDHTIVFEKRWIKKNSKSIYGVVLKEDYVVDFIKSNPKKYTINQLGKIVILGASKVPKIIQENNLYEYMLTKERKTEKMSHEVAAYRIYAFLRYKNKESITIGKLGDLVGCSHMSVQRIKKEVKEF